MLANRDEWRQVHGLKYTPPGADNCGVISETMTAGSPMRTRWRDSFMTGASHRGHAQEGQRPSTRQIRVIASHALAIITNLRGNSQLTALGFSPPRIEFA